MKPPDPTLIRCVWGSLDALGVVEAPDLVAEPLPELIGVDGIVAETSPFCDESDGAVVGADTNDCAEAVDRSRQAATATASLAILERTMFLCLCKGLCGVV